MLACPRCGHHNAPDVDFCANCGKYLGWATGLLPEQPREERPREERPVVPEPTTPAEPRAEPVAEPVVGPASPAVDAPVEQRLGVRLEIESPALVVVPGNEVAVTVTVHNTGTTVEEYRLRLTGAGAEFASVEPAELSVYPGTAQPVVVRFTAPREPSPSAGETSFTVEATSAVHAGVVDRVSGSVTVEPFTELVADLQPKASRGRDKGTHQVLVSNTGNVPVTVDVSIEDPDSLLDFVPPRVDDRVVNGATRSLPIEVAGPHRWFGRSTSHPFTAEVAGGERPITLSGVRHQEAVFPWWVPPAAIAAVVLVGAFLVAMQFFGNKVEVPDVADLPAQEAANEVAAAGLVPEVRNVMTPDAERGQAFRTFPDAGTDLDPGAEVLVMVSAGTPNEGVAAVPNVEGLSAEQAEALVEEAGLEVEVREAENAAAEGTVLATEQVPGSTVPENTTVRVQVSGGPNQGDSVDVPDVKGLSAREAAAELEDAGLAVRTFQVPFGDAEPGEVLNTLPPAGVEVGTDSTVTVVVARAGG